MIQVILLRHMLFKRSKGMNRGFEKYQMIRVQTS